MKQITVKRAIEALNWIHNNAHEEVGTVYHPHKMDENGFPLKTHMYFRNHFETMRVPQELCAEVFSMIRPNRRKFDTRMFALRRAARLRIGV